MLPATVSHILGNEYATAKIMPKSRKSCQITFCKLMRSFHDEFSMIWQDFWTFEFVKLSNNDGGLSNTAIGECLISP